MDIFLILFYREKKVKRQEVINGQKEKKMQGQIHSLIIWTFFSIEKKGKINSMESRTDVCHKRFYFDYTEEKNTEGEGLRR